MNSISVGNSDKSPGLMDCDNLIFSCTKIWALGPWSAYIDMVVPVIYRQLRQRSDQQDIVLLLDNRVCSLCSIHAKGVQFDLAENHCQQALMFTKLYEGMKR
jgi:hypothetical protein